MPETESSHGEILQELGVAGAKISGGFVHEDILPSLHGQNGVRTFTEMRLNNDIISAFMFAVEMTIRSVKFCVESDAEGTKAQEAIEFLKGVLFDDMEHTWDDFLSDILSMLTYGWQYSEIVFKLRQGMVTDDPTRRSKFNDGKVGIRKIADRSQSTLDRWEVSNTGEILGLWQYPPNGSIAPIFIPIEKAILFRPHQWKNSPEGRSPLRGAYRSWYFLKRIEEIEAIAIEMDATGVPVVYIPNDILKDRANPYRREYEELVKNIKYNSQGGVVLPSDMYSDYDGKPSAAPQVRLELLSIDGQRSIDTDKVITRLQRNIVRTVMADFLMLGTSGTTGGGSFALSQDKTKMFTMAVDGWLDCIVETINRVLVLKLWEVNGFDLEMMPKLAHKGAAPDDIEKLGAFIKDLATSGAVMFPDDDLEDHLRNAAGLPAKPVDAYDVPGQILPEDTDE